MPLPKTISIKKIYDELLATYERAKEANDIPSQVECLRMMRDIALHLVRP